MLTIASVCSRLSVSKIASSLVRIVRYDYMLSHYRGPACSRTRTCSIARYMSAAAESGRLKSSRILGTALRESNKWCAMGPVLLSAVEEGAVFGLESVAFPDGPRSSEDGV